MANYGGGEAANYYNQQQPPPPPNAYYQGQPPQHQQYGQQQQGGGYAPPSYPPPDQKGEPPSYEETFKIAKPKWNDLWAGVLFLLTVAGFAAVSAISINGYGESRISSLLPLVGGRQREGELTRQPPPVARTRAASTDSSTRSG